MHDDDFVNYVIIFILACVMVGMVGSCVANYGGYRTVEVDVGDEIFVD